MSVRLLSCKHCASIRFVYRVDPLQIDIDRKRFSLLILSTVSRHGSAKYLLETTSIACCLLGLFGINSTVLDPNYH